MSTKTNKKAITPTMEDYLEAIDSLEKEKKVVRVKDIAKKMGVSMSTVTSMLKNLSKAGLVEYERYGYIELTENGKEIGREIGRRHRALKKFLEQVLGIDKEIAEIEACKMEHGISTSTLDRFTDFMDFIESCPRTGKEWLSYFHQYRSEGKRTMTCKKFSGHLEEVYQKIKQEMNGEN